jgi:hypothetical protein
LNGDRSIYRVSALGQFTVTVMGNADVPLPVLIKKRCEVYRIHALYARR